MLEVSKTNHMRSSAAIQELKMSLTEGQPITKPEPLPRDRVGDDPLA